MAVYAFAPPRLGLVTRSWLSWTLAAITVAAIAIGLVVSWPQQFATWPQTVLIVFAVALSSTLAYRFSSVDQLLSFGFAAAILAVLGPFTNPVFTISAWCVGVLLGRWARSMSFPLSAEAALYNGIAAIALVSTWNWLDATLNAAALPEHGVLASLVSLRVPQIVGSVIAYYLVFTLISILRVRFLTLLGTRETILRTSWLRLTGMCALETVTAVAVFIIAGQLNSAIFQTSTPFGRTVLIILISAVAFGISGRLDAHSNRKRLDSLVIATLQLPWPANSPVNEQAAVLAQRALPQFRVSSIESQLHITRDHVQSVPIEGDGPARRLLATRRPGRSPFRLEDRQILDAIAQVANETIRARKEVHSLRRMANTDRLTGLLNYRAFQATLDDLSAHHRDDNLVALIFIDIDDFKSINDTYGHEAGNEVLQTLAKRIDALIAEPHLVARVGGDEFVIMLQHLGSRDEAEAIQQQLRDQVNRPVQVQGAMISIRISQGIAFSAPDQHDLSALVELADRRMYASRGKLLSTDVTDDEPVRPGVNQSKTGGISLTLRDAILQHRLQLVYQPIIDLRTNEVTALEALVRYRDTKFGLVSTEFLLGEAARFNILGELSRQVIEEAMSALERVNGLFPTLRRMHVNVSLEQLFDGEIHQLVRAVTAKRPGLELVLEINEQSLRHSTPEGVERAKGITNRLPVLLAIDDIGKAHTALPAVRDYDFSVWKIDRDLMLHFKHERSGPLALGALGLANELSAEVVFEGVETPDQDEWLRSFGAQYAQGYLYGRPLALDELLLRFETGGLAARL